MVNGAVTVVIDTVIAGGDSVGFVLRPSVDWDRLGLLGNQSDHHRYCLSRRYTEQHGSHQSHWDLHRVEHIDQAVIIIVAAIAAGRIPNFGDVESMRTGNLFGVGPISISVKSPSISIISIPSEHSGRSWVSSA